MVGGEEYLSGFEAALRRQHRPRWVWAQFRRECTCGLPLPCNTLAEVVHDIRTRVRPTWR